MLGYSVTDPTVCQETGVERRKRLMTLFYRTLCLYDNMEATGWQCVKKSTNEMGKNNVACTDPQYIPAPLRFGHLCNRKSINRLEIPANFHFHEPEKFIKLAKK